jgi:hypothetical protein
VLNTCDSLGTANTLHGKLGVPVIAHEQAITDAAGLFFARELYKGIAHGASFKEAFYEAKDSLLRVHPDDATTPHLLNGNILVNEDRIDRLEDRMDKIEEAVKSISDGRKQDLVLFLVFLSGAINIAIHFLK